MTKSKIYKWFYHSSTKNETSKAVKAALDNNCGLLVLVCKPSCAVCAKACSKDYMDCDGKLLKYMEEHHIVGLKINDSQSHVQSIGSGSSSYYNYDKTKTDKNVPFLLLVKPKEGTTVFETLKKKTSIDEFFGGFGTKKMSEQTYANVSAWLDTMLDPFLKYFDNRLNYHYSAVYRIDVPEEDPQKPTADETHEFKTTFKVTFDVSATVWAKDLKTAKQIITKKLKLEPELAEPLSEVQDIEISSQKLESVEVEEVK